MAHFVTHSTTLGHFNCAFYILYSGYYLARYSSLGLARHKDCSMKYKDFVNIFFLGSPKIKVFPIHPYSLQNKMKK